MFRFSRCVAACSFWGLLLSRHTSAPGHHTDAPIGSWPFVKSSQRERERERERKGGSETLQKQPIFPLCVCSFFCSAKLTKRRSSVKSGGGRTCGGAEERIIRNLNLVLTKQNYTHTHTHNRHLACSLAATSSSRRMRASSEALRTR